MPARDPRKTSFLVADKTSVAWARTWPTKALQFSNSDFAETVTNALGLPSPACQRFVGKAILGGKDVLDPYGHILLSHNRLVNRGGARTLWHDTMLFALDAGLHEASIPHTVEDGGVFGGVAGGAYWQQAPSPATRIIPDLSIRGPEGTPSPGNISLYDAKTISDNPTRYTPARIEGRSPRPVEQRAADVHKDYVAHCKHFDRVVHATNGGPGPFERRLAEFGQVTGLVFGHYGETSGGVKDLVRTISEQIALSTGLQEGARSIKDAKAAQKQRFNQTLSILSHRERARLVLNGLQYVGDGTAGAGIQRDLHYRRARFQDRQASYRAFTNRGPSAAFGKSPRNWGGGGGGG